MPVGRRAHRDAGRAGGRKRAAAFHEALAASELFVLLESEAEGESITPRTVEAEGQCHV